MQPQAGPGLRASDSQTKLLAARKSSAPRAKTLAPTKSLPTPSRRKNFLLPQKKRSCRNEKRKTHPPKVSHNPLRSESAALHHPSNVARRRKQQNCPKNEVNRDRHSRRLSAELQNDPRTQHHLSHASRQREAKRHPIERTRFRPIALSRCHPRRRHEIKRQVPPRMFAGLLLHHRQRCSARRHRHYRHGKHLPSQVVPARTLAKRHRHSAARFPLMPPEI